jgi:hypothetical protein
MPTSSALRQRDDKHNDTWLFINHSLFDNGVILISLNLIID